MKIAFLFIVLAVLTAGCTESILSSRYSEDAMQNKSMMVEEVVNLTPYEECLDSVTKVDLAHQKCYAEGLTAQGINDGVYCSGGATNPVCTGERINAELSAYGDCTLQFADRLYYGDCLELQEDNQDQDAVGQDQETVRQPEIKDIQKYLSLECQDGSLIVSYLGSSGEIDTSLLSDSYGLPKATGFSGCSQLHILGPGESCVYTTDLSGHTSGELYYNGRLMPFNC